ncbi:MULTISPECIES: glycosyltransferase [unclassified Pseudoclavibacter]|uniref:glycosyltransferase n=1 Tax=unclassified Pseudoclavibacter TaxID=2615177 RepID=UPI001BAA9391|nr:glycosyltransferase [Pseudoclavibacter sp. Marseille-Q4354]MBS3180205.1 glycosyltransferase [Pseudoclavibacter sp. Marseille-Q4354]
MRMLYVVESTPTIDARTGDGSSLIPYHVALAMPAHVSLEIVSFAGSNAVDETLRARADRVHELPQRGLRDAQMLSLVARESVGAARRMTANARRVVRELSRTADATLVHGPHLLSLLDAVVGPCAYQSVDPWSFRLEMEAVAASGPRALYRRSLARARLAQERDLPRHIALATVSRADAERWRAELDRDVEAIPNGVSGGPGPGQRRVGRPERPTLSFTGSLDYAPNIESATRLVREIAPVVWAEEPSARILIAGRNPVDEVLALASDRVEVLANVPSMSEVYAASDIAVFADVSGLGIRNSVSEALAAGTPVVATPIAAREQPKHELLTVVPEAEPIGRRTIDLLRAVRAVPWSQQRVGASAPMRSWEDAAGEYLALLGTASR